MFIDRTAAEGSPSLLRGKAKGRVYVKTAGALKRRFRSIREFYGWRSRSVSYLYQMDSSATIHFALFCFLSFHSILPFLRVILLLSGLFSHSSPFPLLLSGLKQKASVYRTALHPENTGVSSQIGQQPLVHNRNCSASERRLCPQRVEAFPSF